MAATRDGARRVTRRWFSRLLLITLMLETGVVLIAVPWSTYWERNLFFDLLPAIRGPLQNQFVRGAISGVGAVDVWVGLLDLASLVLGAVFRLEARRLMRRADPAPARGTSGPTGDRLGREQTAEGDALTVGRAVGTTTSDAG